MSVRLTHLIAAPIVALLLALPAVAGASDGLQNCGGGVRAAVVSCPKAKRIANEYVKTRAHSLQGYTCKSGNSQGRCILDRKLVVFSLN
jgi:hypothetical protein